MNEDLTIVAQLEAANLNSAKLTADLDAANALLSETNGKLQLALAENATLAADLGAARADNLALMDANHGLNAQLEAANAEAATTKAALEAASAKLALKAFADIPGGRDPINGAGGDTGTSEDLWAAYAAIKDPAEKRAFYLKNIKPTLG